MSYKVNMGIIVNTLIKRHIIFSMLFIRKIIFLEIYFSVVLVLAPTF